MRIFVRGVYIHDVSCTSRRPYKRRKRLFYWRFIFLRRRRRRRRRHCRNGILFFLVKSFFVVDVRSSAANQVQPDPPVDFRTAVRIIYVAGRICVLLRPIRSRWQNSPTGVRGVSPNCPPFMRSLGVSDRILRQSTKNSTTGFCFEISVRVSLRLCRSPTRFSRGGPVGTTSNDSERRVVTADRIFFFAGRLRNLSDGNARIKRHAGAQEKRTLTKHRSRRYGDQ